MLSPSMHANASRLFRRKIFLVVLLVTGYAGFYLCRSSLSATLPLLRADLVENGFDSDVAKVRLGDLASIGILAYALGKFLGGAGIEAAMVTGNTLYVDGGAHFGRW